ncbi:MAG: hypothetical protein ACLQOZ_01315 [Acidimicrobiales bacterium]|jgi:hypothetical protein
MISVPQDAITIVDRTAVKEVGDRIEVEWELSAKPQPEWAEIFQMAAPSDRVGPVDWVMGGGPDVIDRVVRWFVPASEIDNADTEVRYRLSVANQRYGTPPSPPDV